MSYKYKEISLPWLEHVPEHWEMVRNKVLLSESKNTVGTAYAKYQLLSLTKSGVIIRDLSSGKGKFPSDFGTYNTVEEEQIVFCLFDIDETPRTVGLSSHNGMITGAYDVFYINCVNPRFLEYYYISLDNVKAMRPLYSGLRKVIGINTFMQTHFPLPPRDEQDQIVRYLDWKVSLINKLINVKKRKIELLKEICLSSINYAISHGLSSDVSYKETDITWVSKIPVLWETTNIKNHFNIKKRIAGKEGYEVLSITQKGLKVKDITTNEGQMAANYDNYQFVYPGDFAMNHMDLLTGYIDISKHFGVTSPDYRVFILTDTENCLPEYFLRVFQVCYKRRIFYGFGRGAATHGRWRLPKDSFLNFLLPIPSMEEQRDIARYCNKVENTTFSIVSRLENELLLLAEYRTRLISDVVTGKFDLRGVIIPEYEVTDDSINDEENVNESEE